MSIRDAAKTAVPPEPAPSAAVGGGERRLWWLGVGGVVLTFVMLASLWLYVPTYRPADEASHVAYARELSHGRLPTIDTQMVADGDLRLARVLRSRDARRRTIWTANHPPAYYALVAVPLRARYQTFHSSNESHSRLFDFLSPWT